MRWEWFEQEFGALYSHWKDFRLGRSFLKRENGDSINLLLAATASNLSLCMHRAFLRDG